MDSFFAGSHPSVKRFARSLNTRDDFLKKVADVTLKHGIANVSQSALTFDVQTTKAEDIASCLKKFGVVCLNNAVDSASFDVLNHKVDKLFSDIYASVKGAGDNDSGDLGELAWQRNLSLARTFNELLDYSKPIVNIRGNAGSDTGMMDMFNIQSITQLKADDGFRQLYELFTSGLAYQVIRSISSFTFSNVQMYENESVTDTRGFHIDNIFGTYKVFVYLTDVTSKDEGPYCYIPGSHRLPYLHRLELRQTEKSGIRPRDMLSSEYLPYIRFIAPRGTIIISNQTGIHRGYPQVDGASRRVIVANYSDHIKMGRRY